MTVDVYPVNPSRSLWTFDKQPGVEPVRVQVPPGTTRKKAGEQVIALLVPGKDKLVRVRWSAGEVMWAIRKGSRQFVLENPRYQIAI